MGEGFSRFPMTFFIENEARVSQKLSSLIVNFTNKFLLLNPTLNCICRAHADTHKHFQFVFLHRSTRAPFGWSCIYYCGFCGTFIAQSSQPLSCLISLSIPGLQLYCVLIITVICALPQVCSQAHQKAFHYSPASL